MSETPPTPPAGKAIESALGALGERVRRTPTWEWRDAAGELGLPAGTRPVLKLELLQHTGTFKVRGALLNTLDLDDEGLARGVTAVSAGNHALAVAFAARALGTTAKVVMPESANPARVEGCRRLGAEVVLVADVHRAFEEVERIERDEGRAFVHPFDGPLTVLGTATAGWEMAHDAGPLDDLIVPIGGGGLISGVASAFTAVQPNCRVWGVEPEGADTMHRSFAAGRPQAIEQVRTVADSLGAPHAAPYTFGICRQLLHGLVKITDEEIVASMRVMFERAKLAVEPAAAAALAALRGPLARELAGRRVGLFVCGSNIDLATFHRLLSGSSAPSP